LFFFVKVWGVIWLVIAFIFFILGVFVGIIAFKVTPIHYVLYLLCVLTKRRVITLFFFSFPLFVCCGFFVAIGGSAGAGRGALFARAGVEECRDRYVVSVESSRAARRHAVFCISRFAMIGTTRRSARVCVRNVGVCVAVNPDLCISSFLDFV
jgi:hypothetical protein